MRIPFFTSDNKGSKNKKRSLSRSNHPSFTSSSSSDPDLSTTSGHRRPLFLGRNASCLDPEYYPAPAPPPLQLDSDGKIARQELEVALRRLGSDGAGDILAEADRDGDGRIALEDLVNTPDEEEELKVAFDIYDANRDGKISPEELYEVLRLLGDGCSVADCRRMIGGVDSDGDGFVCFRDFTRMLALQGRR